ncbi:MAG: hypothetical protein CMK32_12465 [Porticoccaceae bacterium]|nr:hypothetical protein [Porticoccaceae bacterium]
MMPTLVESDVLERAVASVIDSIAPTWPLDRMIAVNPHWGRIQQPFDKATLELANIAGSPPALPLSEYRKAWRCGEITEEDLQQALAESAVVWTSEQLIAALDEEYPLPVPLPLLSDRLDSERDLQRQPSWCDTITHQVSQFCAAYFDRDQAYWHPDQNNSLYASWRYAVAQDHSVPLLMHTPKIAARAERLAGEGEKQIAASLVQLAIPENEWTTFLQVLLMRVNGWAAWCAYRRWQARLDGGEDRTLVDLLAIRLSWECLLDDGERGTGSSWASWKADWQQRLSTFDRPSLEFQQIWQRAQEIHYQRTLRGQLLAVPSAENARPDATPAVQAAFCIDVRSEIFRRHLEAQSPDIQTLGFAGFFGLPISYTPLGTGATRPQLPGLLAPSLNVTDSSGDPGLDRKVTSIRTRKLRPIFGWRVFQTVPLSSFTLVETLGLGYLGDLVKRSLPGGAPHQSDDGLGLDAGTAQAIRPTLDETVAGGVVGQARIASQVLRGMGLDKKFGRIVLLVGHGSQNRNNPHRAGLDCGACCGQTGEVNARVLAGLLNSVAVREQLRTSGIEIPGSTYFVAGLHNTTTDEVGLLDLQLLPASHEEDIKRVKAQLAAAGALARRERAPALGLQYLVDKPEALLRALRERADDWAQTRPEWGLADNAAFVIAPRKRTRGVNLGGRSFLHDYDHRRDRDGSLLEQIMTAPMIVTHWINMQYYASTVDNRRYGSGNKTLHNVVGGRIGVFEGNGGDLRIGLPWQSLNDGERWLHTPLRLTVVIEASREAIDRVIAKHETVRQLVHNRWLYILRLDRDRMERYCNDRWQPWTG